LHLARERSRFLLLKTIEEFELRCRARGDFFDFVLAEDIRTEYLIAVERDRDGSTGVVHHLYSFVGRSPGRVSHVCLGAQFDRQAPRAEVCLDQSIDCLVPWPIDFGIWHQSEAEA